VSEHTAHIKKNLNTFFLKNYHTHDHCLLSQWKRATCVETTSMQHANAVLKRGLPVTCGSLAKWS